MWTAHRCSASTMPRSMPSGWAGPRATWRISRPRTPSDNPLRLSRQRPEVGDQTDEREATHRRLSSGAGYGPDGDIRAGNTKAVREQPERLRANAKRGVEHGVRARPPMLGNERSEHLTLTTDARLPILVDEVIQRCQSVVERLDCHSITRSARSRSDGGIVRPRAFAVLRLMTSSNLVGCWTGRSEGLAPYLGVYAGQPIASRRGDNVRPLA